MGGGSASIIDDPIPKINPTEFGSTEKNITARVDGVRAIRGTSRFVIIGLLAETDEDDYGGEEPVTIDEVGHFVSLSTGSLRELQTDLWGAQAWGEIYEAAVFTANETNAAAHGLRPKPMSASARAIVDKPPPGGEAQQEGDTTTNLGDDLEGESSPMQRSRPRRARRDQALPVLRHQARGGRRRPPCRPSRKRKGRKSARGINARRRKAAPARRQRRTPPRRMAGRRCFSPRPTPA